MPIYEYSCNVCKNTYDEYVPSLKKGESTAFVSVCPVCHSDDVKKIVSLSSFHLKGSGWAKDNYSKVKD
jgi:putative FmdB family regulatory protein